MAIGAAKIESGVGSIGISTLNAIDPFEVSSFLSMGLWPICAIICNNRRPECCDIQTWVDLTTQLGACCCEYSTCMGMWSLGAFAIGSIIFLTGLFTGQPGWGWRWGYAAAKGTYKLGTMHCLALLAECFTESLLKFGFNQLDLSTGQNGACSIDGLTECVNKY
jgi:hypothetical protein